MAEHRAMQEFTQREEPNVIRNEESDDNYDFAGALNSDKRSGVMSDSKDKKKR